LIEIVVLRACLAGGGGDGADGAERLPLLEGELANCGDGDNCLGGGGGPGGRGGALLLGGGGGGGFLLGGGGGGGGFCLLWPVGCERTIVIALAIVLDLTFFCFRCEARQLNVVVKTQQRRCDAVHDLMLPCLSE